MYLYSTKCFFQKLKNMYLRESPSVVEQFGNKNEPSDGVHSKNEKSHLTNEHLMCIFTAFELLLI